MGSEEPFDFGGAFSRSRDPGSRRALAVAGGRGGSARGSESSELRGESAEAGSGVLTTRF